MKVKSFDLNSKVDLRIVHTQLNGVDVLERDDAPCPHFSPTQTVSDLLPRK